MKQRAYRLPLIIFALVLCLISACAPSTTHPSPEGCPHIDTDDNGYCDDCGRYVIVLLEFYVINDLHGKLADGDTHPGVDEMTTYIKLAMQNDDHSLL